MRESLLTAHEVAELLGVPSSCMHEQSRGGRLPTVTLGRYRRYRREAVLAGIRAAAEGAHALGPKTTSETA